MTKVEKKDANLATHGVNNAMALTSAAVWWQLTGERGDRDALYRMFEMLDRYHGQPSGIFASDEHYAGPRPIARHRTLHGRRSDVFARNRHFYPGRSRFRRPPRKNRL